MNIWCFLNIFGRRIDLKFYTSLWKWDLCSCILLVKLVFWTDGLTMAMLISRNLIQNGIFIFTFFVTNRNIASGLRESELILSWPDIFCASFSDSSPLSVTSHCPTFGNTDISNLKDIFEKRLNHLYLISFHIEFYLLRIFLKNQLEVSPCRPRWWQRRPSIADRLTGILKRNCVKKHFVAKHVNAHLT